MMPKSKVSRAAWYWMVMLALSGACCCCPAYAQVVDHLDSTKNGDEEEDSGIAFLRLRNFRATPTFATDGPDDVDIPLISLTWTNPPEAVIEATVAGTPIYQLTLYKSTKDFPMGPLDGIRISLPPNDEAYLDREVQDGITYYYTLVGDIPGGIPQSILDEYPTFIIGEFPQMRYAKATAGAKAPDILTSSFGYDPSLGEQEPFNLAYSQITICPVGPPLAPLGEPVKGADYSAYEATVTRNVYELPVKRSDAQGNAYTLTPLSRNNLFELLLGNMRFPFFGIKYDRLYISANGYIVFDDFFQGLDADMVSMMDLLGIEEEDYDIVDVLDSPNLAGHFAIPRISFLFSWLQFDLSGAAWARMLPDRVVITFEQAAEYFFDPFFNPSYNTVQVELFFSGQIRMTYHESFVYYGIVGISDGRGAPVDPTQVFDDVEPAYGLTDFISLPSAPAQLSVNPVAPPIVQFGEDAIFSVSALAPQNTGLPRFTAEWDYEGHAPFSDIGGGFGKFFWQTDYDDVGAHTVRVLARVDGMKAYQDVRVIVGDGIVPPSAVNLLLSTNTPDEDPSLSRPIAPGQPLIASYTYYHPYRKQSPLLYEEGLYLLYWFRNDQVVTSLTNSLLVPSHLPQPGERWRFQITPITLTFIFGAPENSPVVTVLAVPEITTILPAQGLTIGGDAIIIRGKYFTNPLSVKFGDAVAASVRIISNTEIEVITPLHPAGKVTVSIETPGGVGRSVDVFAFISDKDDEVPDDGEDDKQRRILGCGNTTYATSPSAGDFLLAVFVMLVLVISTRRQNAGANRF